MRALGRMADFVLGQSTREVGETLLACRPVSPVTVCWVTLDEAVRPSPPLDGQRVQAFDSLAFSRTTGANALKRPVLVALGLRPGGKQGSYGLAKAKRSGILTECQPNPMLSPT